ncbi:MAG: hypothetical protein M3440_11685 [Chloroflexota bacterium]|nr:hypothetical protein [Chloroflexota bacterium]
MANPAPATPAPMSPNSISDGDALARGSQWQAAVAQWVDGYADVASTEQSAREQRVRWVIRESGTSIGEHNREQERRRNAFQILLLGMVFAAIATTLIVIGTASENGTVPVLAVGGWIGIVASITCAITYVLRLNRAAARPVNASLSDDEIARARALAEAIDRKSAGRDHATDDGVD